MSLGGRLAIAWGRLETARPATAPRNVGAPPGRTTTDHFSLGSQGVGRGCGVGRSLGIGELLGVGVGRGVELGVAVGVGVGVAQGVSVYVRDWF